MFRVRDDLRQYRTNYFNHNWCRSTFLAATTGPPNQFRRRPTLERDSKVSYVYQEQRQLSYNHKLESVASALAKQPHQRESNPIDYTANQ